MNLYRLKRNWMLCSFAIILSFVSCSKDDIPTDKLQQHEALSEEEKIFKIVNTHRATIGKPLLQPNTRANTLAYQHTLYMIGQQDISHDGFGTRSDILIAEEGATKTGENVAYGQPTANAVMKAWLNSSGHRKNIEGDFTHIGIAAVKNSSGTYFFTQLFLKKSNNR